MFALWRLWRRIGGWRAIAGQALLTWRLFTDSRVPILTKLILPATLVYYFSPINLLFQWIPIIGQIDDIGIALLAIGAFLRACPQAIIAEHAFRLEDELVKNSHTSRLGRAGRLARPSFEKWTSGARPVSRGGGARQ